MLDEILIDEYSEDIKRANKAFERLKSEAGYTNDQAIAHLGRFPIQTWQKQVHRIIRYKKQDGILPSIRSEK